MLLDAIVHTSNCFTDEWLCAIRIPVPYWMNFIISYEWSKYDVSGELSREEHLSTELICAM